MIDFAEDPEGFIGVLFIVLLLATFVLSELITPKNEPLSGLKWLWRWCPCGDCRRRRHRVPLLLGVRRVL